MHKDELIADKLSRRNSKLLQVGSWTSNAGNRVFDYANSILILSLGAKATKLMAAYQSTETVISILFNIFGGAMADGTSKKKICVVTDFISATICFALAMMLNNPAVGLIVVMANALLACVNAFNSPTYKAIIREVIKKEELINFNSIMHGVNQAISLVSPVLGVCLVKYIGIRGALLIDGVTFGVSAVLEIFLKPLPGYEINGIKKKNLIQEIKMGIKYMLRERKILFLIIMSACVNFFLAAYNLSLPFSENIFGRGFYSKVLIAEAVGGISGSFICSKLKKSANSLILMTLYLCISGIVLLSAPGIVMIIENRNAILLTVVLFSLFMTIYNVHFFTYVQANVQQEFLGRVFSIVNTIALIFVPLGATFFSFALKFDDLLSYIVSGIGIVIISLISFGIIMLLIS